MAPAGRCLSRRWRSTRSKPTLLASALDAAGEHGFALAGGNALVAHGVVARDTEDVDLFSPEPGGAGAVAEVVCEALRRAGYAVEICRSPEAHQGEYARLEVTRGEETMHVDLARDWRRWPPVLLDVGPVLHLDDAASSKVNAMVTRHLPRDFIDVAAVLDRYSREELMRLTFTRDPGLRVADFTQAAQELDRLPSDKFSKYGLDDHATEALRQRFAGWPRHEADDEAGRTVHAAVAAEEARSKTAAGEKDRETPPELRAMHAAYPEGIDAALTAGQPSPAADPPQQTPSAGPDYRPDPPGRSLS